MKKEFIGDCVGNPFKDTNELSKIIDNGKEISKSTFLKNCEINEELKKQIKQFPYDYQFFKYKDIFFFSWSMIEHFFK